jgi:hypothetical protein
MTNDRPGYVARRPRHHATGEPGARIQIERPHGSLPRRTDVELLDLSRSGAKLWTSVPLAVEEAVTLRLHHVASGVSVIQSATVRWRHRNEEDTWLVGCEFSESVDWETLGELFLNGILVDT